MEDLSYRSERAVLLTPEVQEVGDLNDEYRELGSSAQPTKADQISEVSMSKEKHNLLFAGPPPPIATSKLFYADEEGRLAADGSRDICSDRDVIRSTLLVTEPSIPALRGPPSEPDPVWRSLQRRQRAIEKDLQYLLDVQAAGLSRGSDLARSGGREVQHDAADDTGLLKPTEAPSRTPPATRTHRMDHLSRVASNGQIVPVRQPQRRKIGLNAARKELRRSIASLADLKAEEDASLMDALSTRKGALAQLRGLSARKNMITEELQALEADDKNPLAQELKELSLEHHGICKDISELEERLTSLRSRRHRLETRLSDISNRRDAGLSGYRGALRDVEDRVRNFLSRPPVRPLDTGALPLAMSSNLVGGVNEVYHTSGHDFLTLPAQRRTIEMAGAWWEGEIQLLETRKSAVDKEKQALHEGAMLWQEVVELVSEFEASFSRQIKQRESAPVKIEDTAIAYEDVLPMQLEKIRMVARELGDKLAVAEQKRWNLLICAIGAELEAFQAAECLTRNMMDASEIQIQHDGSPSGEVRRQEDQTMPATDEAGDGVLGVYDQGGGESDIPVPARLVLSGESAHSNPAGQLQQSHRDAEREDSENDVPPEFLAEHHEDE